MNLDQLEKLEEIAETASLAVCAHLKGSFVENDGGGPYLYIPLTDAVHAIAFVDTLEGDEKAPWTVQCDEVGEVWTSSFDASSPAEEVARWIDSTVEAIKVS